MTVRRYMYKFFGDIFFFPMKYHVEGMLKFLCFRKYNWDVLVIYHFRWEKYLIKRIIIKIWSKSNFSWISEFSYHEIGEKFNFSKKNRGEDRNRSIFFSFYGEPVLKLHTVIPVKSFPLARTTARFFNDRQSCFRKKQYRRYIRSHANTAAIYKSDGVQRVLR